MKFKLLSFIVATVLLVTCNNSFMDDSIGKMDGMGGSSPVGSGKDVPSLGLFYINSSDDMKHKIQDICHKYENIPNKKLYFILGADVVVSGSPLVKYDYTGDEPQPTIDPFIFSKEFYGAGYSITTDTTVFAEAEGAVFDGVIVNASIDSHPGITDDSGEEPVINHLANVGALVGKAKSSSFNNVAVRGSINFEAGTDATGTLNVGGMVGFLETGGSISISSSGVSMDIKSDLPIVAGGLAGDSSGRAMVQSFYAGALKIQSTGGAVTVGGLAGKSGTINKSYANGKIDATASGATIAGGLAGESGAIADCASCMSAINGSGSDIHTFSKGSSPTTSFYFASMTSTGTLDKQGDAKPAVGEPGLTDFGFYAGGSKELDLGVFYDPDDDPPLEDYDWKMATFPVLKDHPVPAFIGLTD